MSDKHKTYMFSSDLFDQKLTKTEKRLLSRLTTPNKIQLFLDDLSYATETIYRAPLRVLHERACQCFDGAIASGILH